MMSDRRDPHAEALRIVGHRLETGAIAPGQPLVITEIALELGISPTPVREALAWLCGSGRLRRSPRYGYETFLPSANDLVELFEIRRILLHGALGLLDGPVLSASLAPWAARGDDVVARAIVQACGNAHLTEVFTCLASRLSAVDRAFHDDHATLETNELAILQAWVDRSHEDLMNRVVEISRDLDRQAREAAVKNSGTN